MLKALLSHLSLLLLPAYCFANSSAVILQYHHVSDDTPASTSISPSGFKAHLEWIKEHQFEVLSLPEIISNLQTQKRFNSSKVLAITFDDANRSVCETAWPILKEYNFPFTLFISTEGVEKSFQSQCSWSQLKEIYQSGLMTVANHSHTHLNMVSGELLERSDWSTRVKNEITTAQHLIETHIGEASHLFAYPYGEYNTALASIVSELGFVGVGQHSGAAGFESDFKAIPRFPASGKFADLETLSVKLYSLAFPARLATDTENPIDLNSTHNPPTLRLSISNKKILNATNCFDGQGEKLPTKVERDTLIIQAKEALSTGRHRYTCTSKSEQDNRFYWLSHQWLIEDTKPGWFNNLYNRWFNQ